MGVPSLFGLFATLLAGQPASKIVNNFRDIYQELKPCRVTGISYSDTIHFSHVFPPSSDARGLQKDGTTAHNIFHQVASSHNYTKNVIVYLPGLDAAGISAYWQFPSLSEAFELWRMTVDTQDRSSFVDLNTAVTHFIDDLVQHSDEERTIVLVGESFGGLLAPSVALRRPDKIKGLVLVNPATSFDETRWSTLAPLLASLRHLEDDKEERKVTPYSVLGGLVLSAAIPDRKQFGTIVDLIRNVPVQNQDDLNDVLNSMIDGFGILQDKIPAETLEHRIKQWLAVGTMAVNPRLSDLRVKTLVVAGHEDKMLPTKREAQRLIKSIPNCTKIEFTTSGHFVLDERVNLTQVILESHIFPQPKYDPILDWRPPSKEYTEQRIDQRIKPLRLLTGPVFFSTDENGKRYKGLSRLPRKDGRPLLFVGNHQFGGFDLSLIVAQLVEERDLYVRGLGHPVIFQANTNGDNNGFADPDFLKYGAVEVTPRNYYRLMETGQAALLFPGGVREVFHGKDEAYKLFWPDKVDFVRIAAKFNATIIPLSAIGAADSVNILVDSPDMLKLPFGLGERLANSSRNVMAARYDGDAQSELFVPPFALPKPLPARHYFMFGRPIVTTDVDSKDKHACSKVYDEIKAEMERGFSDLLRARERDPFADSARRIPLEFITGKPAPTFSVDDLADSKHSSGIEKA